MDRLENQFTPFEIHVLKLIVEGKTNKEIAEALNTNLWAIKWHVRKIHEKTDSHDRRMLIVKYYRYFQQ